MCLINPQKVENNGKPITVYKVFQTAASCSLFEDLQKRTSQKPDGFFSPYVPWTVKSYWEIGKTNEELEQTTGYMWSLLKGDGIFTYRRIEDGAFHSYEKCEDAKDLLNWFRAEKGYTGEKFVVGECEIPPDSAFIYIGQDNYSDGHTSCYASQKLKLVRIIEE